MKRLLLIMVLASGCSPGGAANPGAPESGPKPDWSKFGARGGAAGPENIRTVPEEPVVITGVPYLRSLKLSWTRQRHVPTFEPQNETREIPADALQAVLRLDLRALPETSRIRVEWYFGDSLAFRDEKPDRRDGPHDFALTREEKGRLVPLPPGQYRADLFDGPELLKSIPFEVVAQP